MSDFASFVGLGFGHITAPGALDHLLFLLALLAPYRPRDWRHLGLVATAFTIGHSVTLVLVVTHALRLPAPLIEFLIPLTIVLAALENLRRIREVPSGWVRPLLAGGFGLVHGAGFANVLRELFEGPAAVPLLAFNLGIELGQLAILAAGLLALALIDRGLGIPRLRRVTVSLLAAGWAALLAAQRPPW